MRKATAFWGIFIGFIVFATPISYAQQIDEIRNAIKQKGQKWVAQDTSISILPDHEKVRRLGLLKKQVTGREPVLSTQGGATSLATAVDWSNYVSPVRNQGSCGSCWAFATTAALESQILMKDNLPLTNDDRAEQILLSCSGAGNCESGGYIDSASNFLKSTGLPFETDFPYTATDNSCANAAPGWLNNIRRIGAWSYVNTAPANLSAMKNALATYGPLVTTMDVYADFFSYGGGVYEYATGSHQGGHAILIVGYTDDPSAGGGGYFKVKNSWGPGWGSGGYFLIAYSQLGSPVYFGEWTLAYSIPSGAPPATPGSLSATAVSSAQINLTWADTSGNEDGFKIERCLGIGCTNYAQVATAPAGATTFSNTGLAASSYYSYRVRAYNAAGDSGYSNTAGEATPALQPPSAPTSLQAAGVSASQINLTWADTSSNEDGFRIDRCTGAGCSDFASVATVGAGVKSYSNTGLAAGTVYSYRVRAYNAAGDSANSPAASAATVCSCTLSPTSMTFNSKGGTATVTVNTASGCSWTATTTASWVTFQGTHSVNGSGTFSYSVPAANGRRTATITVMGKTHSIVQSKK